VGVNRGDDERGAQETGRTEADAAADEREIIEVIGTPFGTTVNEFHERASDDEYAERLREHIQHEEPQLKGKIMSSADDRDPKGTGTGEPVREGNRPPTRPPTK
jgi:hypothetical protein